MTDFSSSINLSNIKITDQETLDNGDIIVRVDCLENGSHCKCCGKHIIKRHSLNKIIRLKHLPSCGDDVYIKSQLVRYQCIDCNGSPTTTQKPSWYQSTGFSNFHYDPRHLLN